MLVTPLMRTYSATRISSVVLALAWVPITITGAAQLRSQDWALGWEVWALFVFATLGPLVLTNMLWFRSLERIGPPARRSPRTCSRSSRPRSRSCSSCEALGPLELAGGVLIAAGIVVARRRGSAAAPGE